MENVETKYDLDYESSMLTECITYRNKLKEKYTSDMNTINYYFWPRIASHKKKLKNAITFLGSLICAWIILFVYMLLVKNIDIVYRLTFLGVGLVIVGFGAFIAIKTNRNYKADDNDWKKRVASLEPIKNKIIEIEQVICTDIIEAACQKIYAGELAKRPHFHDQYFEETKNKLETEVGLTSDDLIEYYNAWDDDTFVADISIKQKKNRS